MVSGEWASCRAAADSYDSWLLQGARRGLSSVDTLLARHSLEGDPSKFCLGGIFVGHRIASVKEQV